MGERGARRVLGGADAQLFADALAKLLVDGGNAGFAVELDEAVAAAYGWPTNLTDEQILERLLKLNQQWAAMRM